MKKVWQGIMVVEDVLEIQATKLSAVFVGKRFEAKIFYMIKAIQKMWTWSIFFKIDNKIYCLDYG